MMGSCSGASQSLNGNGILSGLTNRIVNHIVIVGGNAEKMSSSEIDELLKYVKMTFADIIISMKYIVKQDFIGKGERHCV